MKNTRLFSFYLSYSTETSYIPASVWAVGEILAVDCEYLINLWRLVANLSPAAEGISVQPLYYMEWGWACTVWPTTIACLASTNVTTLIGQWMFPERCTRAFHSSKSTGAMFDCPRWIYSTWHLLEVTTQPPSTRDQKSTPTRQSLEWPSCPDRLI